MDVTPKHVRKSAVLELAFGEFVISQKALSLKKYNRMTVLELNAKKAELVRSILILTAKKL
jgi:hypothetical protein